MSKELDNRVYHEEDEDSSSDSGSYSDESSETVLDNDESTNESTADLDDVELLKTCSREDLFMLIKRIQNII